MYCAKTVAIGLVVIAFGVCSPAGAQVLGYSGTFREITCNTSVPGSGDSWSTSGSEDVDLSLSCGDEQLGGQGVQISRYRAGAVDVVLDASAGALIEGNSAGLSRANFELSLTQETTVRLSGIVSYETDAGSVLSSASVLLADDTGTLVRLYSVVAPAFASNQDQLPFSTEMTLAAGTYSLETSSLVSYQGSASGSAQAHTSYRLVVISTQTCQADINDDGLLDFFDLQTYLNYYASGDLRADFIADGLLDFFDLQEYLNAYAGGCP